MARQRQDLSVRLIDVPALYFRSIAASAALLCAGLSTHAQLDPPGLRCASVLPNGDVQLSWAVPADPNGTFLEYRVYQSTAAAGPYVQLGTIPVYGITTWNHVGAGAGLGHASSAMG